MSRGHGQLRQSQVITTYGPGALLDLPDQAAIVAGLDSWPSTGELEEVIDERLAGLVGTVTGVHLPRMFAPPPEPRDPWSSARGIGAWSFPEWFVVQDDDGDPERRRSRRLAHRRALDDRGRFDGKLVVPTRFVRACPRGHVDDLNWSGFVHRGGERCGRQLWLDERGTTGDLSELVVRCECGKSRRLYEATEFEHRPLGTCRGKRPWLGLDTDEECDQPSRLLIRTASNAYFAQVLSALSLPDRGSAVEQAVRELWDDLQIVDNADDLQFIKKKPKVTDGLSEFADDEVIAAIGQLKSGSVGDRPVKVAELEALLAAPEGYGDDIPVDPDFHARRLPDAAWREPESGLSGDVEAVVQLHRLREVQALIGFTRFEAAMRDIHGEYDTDVERAEIAIEPRWFPAVENRGEGVFVHLRQDAVGEWLTRPAVIQRLDRLVDQHEAWQRDRRRQRPFPGGPYIMLHTLAHLLIQSMSMRCGYPASSIRERVYVEDDNYGLLLYTGTPDAEGTLGGLVQQARHLEGHLGNALEMALLCSNDPICAQHATGDGMEQRFLHGAACHGCALIAETSCEMRNDYLDRALVVPVLGVSEAAFFPSP
ncbi:DrmB family protein [Candidatus Poriferisodalis sp.]|uniref:DrmB family protein n=1 Tax=Candidatus Poriferisodalis sp. TaxID=3101277 RepID=UPI003B021368